MSNKLLIGLGVFMGLFLVLPFFAQYRHGEMPDLVSDLASDLPAGHKAVILEILEKEEGVEVTYIGPNQDGEFELIIAFGSNDATDSIVQIKELDMSGIIRGSLAGSFVVAPDGRAVAFESKTVCLDGTQHTINIAYTSLLTPGTFPVSARFFKKNAKDFVPVSNILGTTVTLK